MIRSRSTLFICAVLLFSLSFAQSNTAVAQGSAAEELLTAVPDDVLGFVATSGGDSLKPAFEKAILGRLWHDPGAQTFFESIKKELLAKMEQQMHDPDAAEAVDTVRNFAGLVLSRPMIVGAAQKQAPEGPPLYGFAILDAGPRKAEIASALTKLESLADEGDIIEIEIGSAKMHGPSEADDVPVYWGWVGNYLVFALNDGQGLAMKYLSASRASPVGYLKQVPGSGDALAIHIDRVKIFNVLGTIASREGGEDEFGAVETVIKELGLNNLKTLTARVGFAGPDVVSNCFVEVPQPRTGLPAHLKTIDLSLFDMVDARAMSATALNCDIAGVYDTAMKAIRAVTGEDYAEIEKGIAAVEEEVKFKIREGLLESLSGPMVFYALPGVVTQSPQGGLVLVAKLKDARLWEETWAALGKFAAEKSGGMIQVSSQVQEGRTVHTWAIMPLAVMQVMPSWTVVGEQVVIASNPMILKSAVDQINSGTGSIRGTEGFRKVTAKLPDNLVSLKYSDSKVQFNQMMMGLQQFWPMATMAATKAGLKLPVLLPNLSHIAEDMGPSCQYSWFDARGLRSHYRGVGVEPGLGAVAGGALGAGIMMPALARARSQARQVVSMSNLKQLGLALIMYASDHQDTLPENLEQVKSYYRDAKILESPLKPAGFDGPSYIYIRGHSLKAGSPARQIVVYENPEYCRDKINALFLDGHVEAMQRDRFLDALEETFKQLGRQMPEINFKD